ncbi:MAG: SusC/RagA family TonB-linked outer membrane protein, partial [Dysgonomonas sp.]
MRIHKLNKKLLRFTGILSLMLIFGISQSFSQNARIAGTVADIDGNPLVGASVIVKGTQRGAMSDSNGKFTFESPTNNNVLEISLIGYVTQEITTNGNQPISIILIEKLTELQSVVVIGYGTASKKDLTGAVGVVQGDELNKMPVGSVANILQGKTPGVSVSSSSGTPGAPAVVRIRGIGSINGSNTPLYIVDGLPQYNIDYLTPSDIESITVHKDASVAAIYGARASNGVIMVTTKTGEKNEKITVSYDAYTGFQAPWKRPHMLTASEFIQYKNIAADNAGAPRLLDFSTQANIDATMNFVTANTGSNGTDWWNEITNNQAFMQNHNISVGGGSKNVGILSSLSYLGQEGIIKGSEYQRISWRNNFNSTISKRITLASNFGIIYEKRKVIDENNPFTGTIYSAIAADPITPVFRSNLVDVPTFMSNIYNGYEPNNPFSHYSGIIYSNKRNPVAQIERMRQSKYETLSMKGGANLGIKIFEFLKFDSRVGIDVIRSFTDGFQPKYLLNAFDYSNYNTVINESYMSNYFVAENTLTFDKKFEKFKLGALLGTSAEATNVSSFRASIQGIVSNEPDMRILNAGTINPAVSGYPYSNALLSYFGRVTADYDSKDLFAVNLRRDGSSRFATGHHWGTFPSISAAWRFSSENFLQS